MTRYTLHLFSALVLLTVSGCVRESSAGQAQTFSYEWWVPLSVLLAGVVAFVAGWIVRKNWPRYGWGLLVVGPIVVILFVPSLFRDRAVVDESGFSVRSGIWGLTAVHRIEFEGLQQVRIVSEQVRGRRGSTRNNYYLLCESQDGNSTKIPINNQVSQAAAAHFLERVSQRGIPTLDEA